MFARALLWRRRVIGKVFEDGESRHREDLLFLHQAHGLVAQLIGMVNGNHSRLRGVERSRLAGGMHRDAFAHTRRFFDCCFQLRFGVLIHGREFSIPNRICPSLINLDKVGALFELLAHHCDQFVRAVGIVRVGQNMLLRVVAESVLVAAEDVDRIPADAQSRPRNAAFINRVAHCGVG